MNREIEERFVKKFIVKEKRDRTQYELFSPKKRDNIIHRLINNVDERNIILSESKISDDELFITVQKVFDTGKDCYVIADSLDDGKIMPFKTAFKNMINDCADYIIICGENTVVIKEETVFLPPSKMILHKQ